MNTMVFTVRDTKAGAYLNPFFMPNEQVAIRSMDHCLRDPNHGFALSPEDYALYILGEYDDSTGKFTLLDAPQHMLNLIDLANASDHENVGE